MRARPAIAWVDTIPQDAATGALAAAYAAVADSDGEVENLYLAMSGTPDAIAPADAHYKALLHNPDNPLPPWLAELVATHVAMVCGCGYAVANHGENFCALYHDRSAAVAILAALDDGTWEQAIADAPTRVALCYAVKLSQHPGDMSVQDIAALRAVGFSDKAVSYLIQIVAAFAYWARMINGLGIRLGDRVGVAKAKAARTP